MALVANSRTHQKKPTSITCFNCGEPGHQKNECTLSPWEVYHCHMEKSPTQDVGEESHVMIANQGPPNFVF